MASALGNNRNTGIGNQLARRVSEGKISMGQAQKVKNQRTLLAKAFGPEWRVKIYGKGGARSYPTLGYKGPTELNEVRKKALARAKTKLAVGAAPVTLKNGGTESPWNKREKRSNGGTTAP